MSVKRTLKALSLDEKCKLIKEVDSGSKKKDVAAKYGVPASTVSTILKNKETIVTAVEHGGVSGSSKRLKRPTYENVDKAVLEWFKLRRRQNLPISGRLIKEKALDFSQKLGLPKFKSSTGWLGNWKRRNAICDKKAYEESNDGSDEDCAKWKRDLSPELLEDNQADETGILCLPDNTLTFKNQKCHGGKHSKRNQPRSFRGIKGSPLDYKANTKAWMTGALLEEWVVKLDNHFGNTTMAQHKKYSKKRKMWSDADEDFLVELWAYKIEDLRGPRRNSYIYQEMAESLAAVDAIYTPIEIKIKLHNLTNRYRKEKRIVGPSGDSPSEWRLFHRVNSILGEAETHTEEIDALMVDVTPVVKLENILPSTPPPLCWESSSDSSNPPDDLPSASSAGKRRKLSYNSELSTTDDMIRSQLQAMNETDNKLLKLEEERNTILRDFVNSCDKFHTDLLNILKK